MGFEELFPPGFPLGLERADAADLRGQVGVIGVPDFGRGMGKGREACTVQAGDVTYVKGNEHGP